DDHGKFLRKRLSEFEKEYDADLYSLTSYLDRIQAPLEIHQGGADDAVPLRWTDTLVTDLKKSGKEVAYFTYPSADHNMLGSWDRVIERNLRFYTKYLQEAESTTEE
ncbi:MAG: prolyl oligopeptidase family serine peptidase, partial [bacterium]|nr:prolyl oligopeptidase family serine peptidase [bacterium]